MGVVGRLCSATGLEVSLKGGKEGGKRDRDGDGDGDGKELTLVGSHFDEVTQKSRVDDWVILAMLLQLPMLREGCGIGNGYKEVEGLADRVKC